MAKARRTKTVQLYTMISGKFVSDTLINKTYSIFPVYMQASLQKFPKCNSSRISKVHP